MDDYNKLCIECYCNDTDFGCIVETGERIYQCYMYRFYHPEEVREFEYYIFEKYIKRGKI